MSLELDDRQRAMLQEMGVHVWLPSTEHAVADVTQTTQGGWAAEGFAQVKEEPAQRAGDTEQNPQPSSRPARTTSAPPTAPITAPTLLPSLQGLDWTALHATVSTCQACGLCAGRKFSTLQAQLQQADWMVVGDPPDEDEDAQGLPFAGQSGVLLDNMLKAIGARRDGAGAQGAYLSNVLKCRPPPGRVPQAAELAQCAAYLQREIALVQPKVILALGRFAVQVLLGEHPMEAALPLGKQRGAVYRYCGVPVVVSYHPKVLLRAPADKAKAWADLCLAMDVREGKAP